MGLPSEARESQRKASVERLTYAPVLIVSGLTMKDRVKYADESRQKKRAGFGGAKLGCCYTKYASGGARQRFGYLLVLPANILQKDNKKDFKNS